MFLKHWIKKIWNLSCFYVETLNRNFQHVLIITLFLNIYFLTNIWECTVGTRIFENIQWVPKYFRIYSGYQNIWKCTVGTRIFENIQWIPEYLRIYSGYQNIWEYTVDTRIFENIQWVPEKNGMTIAFFLFFHSLWNVTKGFVYFSLYSDIFLLKRKKKIASIHVS